MSEQLCIMGVDPGLTGAISFYFPSAPDRVSVEDMPIAGKGVDCAALARRIAQLRPDVAIIELVGARPGQGVSSMFKFGVGFGMVQGVVAAAGVEMRFVTPAVWKRHFRLTADKEHARAFAIQLWPSCEKLGRKKDAGRAEAALIARYWAETAGRPVKTFRSAPVQPTLA